ncbi:MAG: hypothetical protein ACUVWX_07845, partial [Kiritimatiellia bacterium]
MTARAICVVGILLVLASTGKPAFVAGPSVRKEGAQRVISFTVSEPTAVEVAICDDSGRPVRHLAAGLLG